jgi:serine/threonine protein kinase
MGEVYKARDTRLDRSVAVKILSAEFGQNAQFKIRFEREAKTISHLSHPHICTLYDVGDNYIVMELLDGESLADRLARGPLPLSEVLKYGVQIAEALSKAHREGVIHRDLKPGNVMLTKTGAKLLDFGLAKSFAPVDYVGATQQKPLTQEGTIVGTVQYMAPEQLEGLEADIRTDIFALGAMLYEMATGKHAFAGKSQLSVASAILEKEPEPITASQPLIPAAFEHAVQRALAKNPEDRWQTAHDLGAELAWALGPGPQAPKSSSAARGTVMRTVGLTLAALLTGTLLSFALLRQQHPAPTSSKLSLLAPEGTSLNVYFPGGGHIAVSPDGERVVFTAVTGEGRKQLWLRPLNSTIAIPLPGTDEAIYPFWSPDSRTIGFFAHGKLKKIDLRGGLPQTLCEAAEGRGGTWNADGVIVFSPSPTGPLYQVSQAGGTPRPVTALDASKMEETHRWPSFLPDGDHFLFFARSNTWEHIGIYVQSLKTGEKKLVLRGRTNAVYASPGYLLFMRDESLMAQPFSLRQLKLTGEPAVIAEAQIDASFMKGDFSVSRDVLVYNASSSSGDSRLVVTDRSGMQLSVAADAGHFSAPSFSRDGKQIAYTQRDANGDKNIWVADPQRGTKTRLTSDPHPDVDPVWSPDGKQIAFARYQGQWEIYLKSLETGREERLAVNVLGSKYPKAWSRDGKFIAFELFGIPGMVGEDLFVLPLSGERKAFPFVRDRFEKLSPEFSTDGRWIAYQSDESGRDEVYVASFPGAARRRQVSVSGGIMPRWRADGRELFFLGLNGKMTAVETQASGEDLTFGPPHELFAAHPRLDARGVFDVTPDGQRFVISAAVREQTALTVVSNWAEELTNKKNSP